ncbi:hypothetical protein ACFL5Z_12370 [Planctomycetota bacterium]
MPDTPRVERSHPSADSVTLALACTVGKPSSSPELSTPARATLSLPIFRVSALKLHINVRVQTKLFRYPELETLVSNITNRHTDFQSDAISSICGSYSRHGGLW